MKQKMSKAILLTAILAGASCHPAVAQVQMQVIPYGEAPYSVPSATHKQNRNIGSGSFRSDGFGGVVGSGSNYGQNYRSNGFGGFNGSGSKSTGQIIRSDGMGGFNTFDFSGGRKK